MKGEITLKILECIGDAAIDLTDLTAAILNSGYGASGKKITGEFHRRSDERIRENARRLERYRQKRRFDVMLSKLKKDGLLKAENNDNVSVKLTSKGKKYLAMLNKRRINALPINSYNDSKSGSKNDDRLIIVIFDIPERERRKRAWLRLALKNIGLRLIQQSVWVGKVQIPKEFLDDIRELQLVNFVEIFEITKSGSLNQVIQ